MQMKEQSNQVKKHSLVLYDTALDFSASGASVLVQIATKEEKSQSSLLNIARQAINRTNGFSRHITDDVTSFCYNREKLCLYCKRPFKPVRSDQKFCCAAHRVRACEQRKRLREGSF